MAPPPSPRPIDLDFVRSQFPAFALPGAADRSFFENAGGSYACAPTIDALHRFYVETKVQPYYGFDSSQAAGAAMDHSRRRWAEALGVAVDEVHFGPSTSMNTYVLAQAFGERLGPGDEIVVTNQDHEANTGVFRRMAARVGATVREWRVDPTTGLLDVADIDGLVTERTRLVTMPQASNVVGVENDVATVVRAAHAVGAHVVVDAVSSAPHGIIDVAALDADVYLFSLYKVFSVHQGLMVLRNGLGSSLPNQSHHFNDATVAKRLNPAGPDHAQVGAAGAVLDYVDAFHRHHGGGDDDGLRDACAGAGAVWRTHEDALTEMLLAALRDRDDVRLLGAASTDGPAHRCPTVAFVPLAQPPAAVAAGLAGRGVQAGSGHFYAARVLEAMGIDPGEGVVRLSAAHYTSPGDAARACEALTAVLGSG